MSKAGQSRAFRKVDVDQFDEDKYEEQDDENEQSFAGPNESDVNGLLAQYPFSKKVFESFCHFDNLSTINKFY